VFVTGNSGFPKSYNIGKGIDKTAIVACPDCNGTGCTRNPEATDWDDFWLDEPCKRCDGTGKVKGAEREVVGVNPNVPSRHNTGSDRYGWNAGGANYNDASVTAPATDEAKLWDGYGTALKPAYESIVVAMKPTDGTYVHNALTWGVAGLNIDGCRVGTERVGARKANRDGIARRNLAFGMREFDGNPQAGRWPANLIHDGSDEVVGLFPENTQRFFYVAKASRSERNRGLDSTCTVKYNVPIGGALCKDVTMALAESLQKVMLDSATAKWLTGESGANIMGLCRRDSLSTTLTEISKITTSQILSCLTPSLISAFTQAVSCETANGGSPVESAESSRRSLPTTIREGCQESARGARLVVSEMLSRISDGANWKPLTNTHSTVKPLELMRYLVRLVKMPTNTIILDPFMGSGTTGMACKLEDRDFIGCETGEESYNTAEGRIANTREQLL